jgi:hypothetical protein
MSELEDPPNPPVPYPTSHCPYINTFIPTHCLHTGINVDARDSFHSQLSDSTLLELHVLTSFHSTGTEPEFG